MFGANGAANTGPIRKPRAGRLRRARGLVAVTSAALSAVLILGAGTALAAPSHAGGGWGRSATTAAPARGSFGYYLPAHNLTNGQIALEFALSQVGKPYLYGGAGPNAYDCSGLAMVAWSKAGVSLTHYTGTQVSQGTRVARSALQPGDLVFFGSAGNVYHVGLYVSGDQGGLMVDAPHTGAFVRVEQIWWNEYYTAVRPG
jgi:cell wall-associated NlpC family hydrolase